MTGAPDLDIRVTDALRFRHEAEAMVGFCKRSRALNATTNNGNLDQIVGLLGAAAER